MNKAFHHFFLMCFLVGLGNSCKQSEKVKEPLVVNQTAMNDSVFPESKMPLTDPNNDKEAGRYSVEITKNKDNSFGYTIKFDGKKLIDQPFIPVRQGINGFRNPEEALKVAGLMVRKLKLGIIPPAITEEELDSLQIP